MTALNIDPLGNALEFARMHNASPEVVQWLENKPNQSIFEAYNSCPRLDWQLWALRQAGIDAHDFVERAIWCARQVLHLVPEGENLPRLSIEAAERCLVDPTQNNTQEAHQAALDSREAAYSFAASSPICSAAFFAASFAAYSSACLADPASADSSTYASLCAAYASYAADSHTADAQRAFAARFAERFPLEC